MASDPGVDSVGLHDHGHGVPTYVTPDGPFRYVVARIGRFLLHRNGVEVMRADQFGYFNAGGAKS